MAKDYHIKELGILVHALAIGALGIGAIFANVGSIALGIGFEVVFWILVYLFNKRSADNIGS